MKDPLELIILSRKLYIVAQQVKGGYEVTPLHQFTEGPSVIRILR